MTSQSQSRPLAARVVPTPVARARLLRDLEPHLRALYDHVRDQPVPERLTELLGRLDRVQRLQARTSHGRDRVLPENRSALIVDGDREAREFAGALLEETGFETLKASSGEEALRHLDRSAGEIGFLFTEVRLPRLVDGVELARTASLKWPWIRTVLTSGAPPEDSLDKALRKVRFMPKPWLPLEVLVEAERALSRLS